MASVGVVLRNEANTTTTNTLAGAFNVSFTVEANRNGVGSFMLEQQHVTATSIPDGSVVLFSLAGTGRFAARVRAHEIVEVSLRDEWIEATEYICEGIRCDFDDSAIRPPTGACDLVPSTDERVFSWTGPDFVETWDQANEIATQGWASTFYTGQPAGWSDRLANYLWDDTGDDEDAPAGYMLFRQTINVTAGFKFLDWTCDNNGILWLNGKRVQEASDLRRKQTYAFATTAGELTIAFQVLNLDPIFNEDPEGGNPGALLASLRAGSPEGTVVWRSSDAMRVLNLGETPVYPPISIGTIFADCRQGNDLMTGWTIAGSATTDAEGETLPTVTELAFRYYEDNVGDLLNIYSDTWLDFTVDATGKTLRPRLKGTTGSASTLDLVTGYSTAGQADPDLVNVLELSWDVRPAEFEGIAVRDAHGWTVRGDDGGRVMPYRVEQITNRGIAEDIADELLAIYGTDQLTATVSYLPLDEATDLPFVAFDLFDTLAVPGPIDHDATSTQTIVAITVEGGERNETTNDDGGIEIELGAPVRTRAELFDAQLQRIGAGALGGFGAGASGGKAPTLPQLGNPSTPPSGGPSRIIASCPNAVEGETVTFPCPFVGKVTALRLIGQGGTGASTVTVQYGATTVTLTGSGEGRIDTEEIDDVTWTTVTSLTVTLTTVNHTHLHVYADMAEV
jgi:hypothetical protein